MRTIVIGICGGSGSGKTTLASLLVNELGDNNSVLVLQDSYYHDLGHLTEDKRSKTNFDHPVAIDWALLKEHLLDLKAQKPVNIPVYDFVSHTRTGEHYLPAARIVILEGHLIFHDKCIRELIDLKVFLQHDVDIMLIRRITRDINERGRSLESILDQYLETVRPMYLDYVEPCSRWADLSITSDCHPDHSVREIIEYLSVNQFLAFPNNLKDHECTDLKNNIPKKIF